MVLYSTDILYPRGSSDRSGRPGVCGPRSGVLAHHSTVPVPPRHPGWPTGGVFRALVRAPLARTLFSAGSSTPGSAASCTRRGTQLRRRPVDLQVVGRRAPAANPERPFHGCGCKPTDTKERATTLRPTSWLSAAEGPPVFWPAAPPPLTFPKRRK